MNMNNIHVAIIGGGCAGLSAAATLIERGIQVTLFESSSQLGGRARTVVVENNDQVHLLDNGQHILLGAYRETLALLKKAGVEERKVLKRLPLQMHILTAQARTIFSLKSAHFLPAPFHTLFALLTCKGLSLSERIAAITLMHRLKSSTFHLSKDLPLWQFLTSQQQSERLIEMLWEPLCLAALNTPLEIASTRVFLNVLKDSFTGNKSNSDFLLPKLDLSQVLAQPVAQYIQAKGGIIRLNKRVRSLSPANSGFNIETREGQHYFSHVVVALSPARVDKLLEPFPKLRNVLTHIQSYSYQPIYTIYLQYPRDIQLPQVMTGLNGTVGQWVFDKGQLSGEKGLLAVIISASGKHQRMPQEELALRIAQELQQVFPQLTKPLWHKVIAEKRATFTCTTSQPRPTNKTAQPGLYLAGDYTYADYPATIEGAVRSGQQCANLIINNLS
ncbi:MAG: desaturase [Methylotenera sp.]|nr:MAG: desaturase [Methylotenera sp.]